MYQYFTLFHCMMKNEIFEFYFITITYKSVNIYNSALIETMKKSFESLNMI